MTEETVAKNLETDFMLAHQAVFVYLTYFLLFCGWALPGFSQGPDDRIPGYIWFFYAAFQVIGIAIWTTVVIATIQYSNSQARIRSNLSMLGMHLISCLGVFIWYCLTALYVYKDSLNHIVRFLKQQLVSEIGYNYVQYFYVVSRSRSIVGTLSDYKCFKGWGLHSFPTCNAATVRLARLKIRGCMHTSMRLFRDMLWGRLATTLITDIFYSRV